MQFPDGELPPHDGHLTSLSLLEELKTGKAHGGERLNRLYGPLIHFWCVRRNVAAQHIDDIRQNVFLVVLRKIADFQRGCPGAFRGWLHAITGYVILEHSRTLHGKPCAEGGTDAGRKLHEFPAPVTVENDADSPVEERRALLHRALELIRPEFAARHWKAFRLVYVEDCTSLAPGRKLGMTAAAVRQATHRIRERALQVLGDL